MFSTSSGLGIRTCSRRPVDPLHRRRRRSSCHRHIVAQWLEDSLGIAVPEVGHPNLDRFACLRLQGINVVVQDLGDGRTEVAAIDPVASMQAIDNPRFRQAAERVRALLKKVVTNL